MITLQVQDSHYTGARLRLVPFKLEDSVFSIQNIRFAGLRLQSKTLRITYRLQSITKNIEDYVFTIIS